MQHMILRAMVLMVPPLHGGRSRINDAAHIDYSARSDCPGGHRAPRAKSHDMCRATPYESVCANFESVSRPTRCVERHMNLTARRAPDIADDELLASRGSTPVPVPPPAAPQHHLAARCLTPDLRSSSSTGFWLAAWPAADGHAAAPPSLTPDLRSSSTGSGSQCKLTLAYRHTS